MRKTAILLVAVLVAVSAHAAVDAPALAAPGAYAVGVTRMTWVQTDQTDVTATDPKTGAHPRGARVLPVEIWYPAYASKRTPRVVYTGAMTGEDGKDVAFTAPGTAVRSAAPQAGSFPLVILAHGYGGTPVAMSWLAENLASKGYIVVGPYFDDPPFTAPAKTIGPILRRPLDIAFVTAEAQNRARAHQGVFARADPTRAVLIGYSMGGYGALKVAATTTDLKAVVAIAPASQFGGADAYGPHGLDAITAPSLFIGGTRDPVVGYDPGVKTVFDAEVHAPRYLLAFENGGHNIGMNAAPVQMRRRLWDMDWWEDAIWRKDQVLAVELHFITAFLDLYVKGDTPKAAYLDLAVTQSADGVWVAKAGTPWDAQSPGAPATLWKGFPRRHAEGLAFRFAPAQK